jgi:hypothetical protein
MTKSSEAVRHDFIYDFARLRLRGRAIRGSTCLDATFIAALMNNGGCKGALREGKEEPIPLQREIGRGNEDDRESRSVNRAICELHARTAAGLPQYLAVSRIAGNAG